MKKGPGSSSSVFLFPVIFALAVFYISPVAGSPKILPPGIIAPTFNLPDLGDKRVSLSNYCGTALSKQSAKKPRQIVVLSFWATYCLPCAIEIPVLHGFAEKHGSDGVKVLLITIDEQGEEIVAPFVDKFNYTLPVLLDPYKKTAARYGVTSLPSLFVIDPEGVIRYSSTGYDKKIDLEQVLEKVIQNIRAPGIADTIKTVCDTLPATAP